jgi:hypothetical protein
VTGVACHGPVTSAVSADAWTKDYLAIWLFCVEHLITYVDVYYSIAGALAITRCLRETLMGVWRCTYCTNYYCILGCLLRRLINVHRYVYSILSRTSHCDTDGDSTSQRTTQEPETACKSDETRSSQSQAPRPGPRLRKAKGILLRIHCTVVVPRDRISVHLVLQYAIQNSQSS